MKKITLLICVLCAFVINLQAQVPNQFNYQAVARNNFGQAIANANIKTKFTILDGSANGTNVYSEVRSLTTNQLGLFTAAIGGSGATNVTGNFATIDWSTGKKFIKVEVDPLGGNNFIALGNTEMLSVPYALYAVNGKIGPVGPPNVLTIGTVTTGNTGSPASATITGTSPTQTLNLTLPTGAQGPQGIQGVQGFKSLLKTTPELPGGNCSTGGQKIESGIDVNNNNILDAAEIISTQFVCNGIQGFKTLLKTTTETAGANCTTGGQKIESGVDLNNNNVLDPAEVTSIAYTCNGAVGPQGFKSLLKTTAEASGANCAAGGQKIETGIDLNNNNILDPAEVTNTSYTCNGDVNNDNKWKDGGLGTQLRDTTDGVEMMDSYTGTSTNWMPKVKISRKIDSALLNAKNNIPVLVLTGVNRKTTSGWDSLQKTSIIFEMNYLTTSGASGTANNVAISSYINSKATTQNTQTQGLAFYVTAPPQNTATADTPSLAMFRHNVGIGKYPTDINNVTEGRVQITGFSNGDQLSLRHPSSTNLKWGLYVSSIDSSLNFYSNGSIRASIDRVTGVYSALSDKTKKKNILPIQNVLNTITKLPVYSYNYLDSKNTDRRMIGLMAQDVQPHFPELVYQRYDRELNKPLLTMDYSGFGVLAIKAIQEQQIIIDDLSTKVKSQQLIIENLLKRIEALENKK